MYRHLLAAAVLIAAVSSSQAQVRVVESSPQSVRSGVGSNPPANLGVQTGGMQTDVLSEIQALKFEIATLRGLVEEQVHEISRLKQQQTENYLDLDTRLSGLSGSAGSASPSIGSSPITPSNRSPVTALPATGGSDAEVYAAAYDLLRQRQYDAAIVALNDYLTRFPNGAYAGNSYYWLGEIYLLRDELPQARDWFDKLLTNFPNDRKVSDTKFKLGKVHHLLGENEKARTLLSDVAAGTGDAARLAKQYLQDNF